MAVGPNLLRRGAVYHWRRRLPRSLVPFMGCSHLSISLNTKDSKDARRLGAHLDAIAMDVLSTQSAEVMTKAQLGALFRAANSQHKAKLDLIADIERSKPTSDRSELLSLELARGEAYSLLSAQGAEAQLDEAGEHRLRTKGFDTDAIIRTLQELEALRDGVGVRFSIAKLTALIEGAGASAVNVAKALPVYLKALSQALLTAPQRYGPQPAEALDYQALLNEPQQQELSQVAVPVEPAPAPKPETREDPTADGRVGEDWSITTIGNRLILKKTSAKENAALRAEPGEEFEARALASGWDDKAARQARSSYDCFSRFMGEVYGSDDLSKLGQLQLAAFEEFLRRLRSNYGRSPDDKTRPVSELEAGTTKETKLVPIGGSTINRHLGNLGQLIEFATAVGVPMDPKLDTTTLRAKKNKRGRDQRSVPAQASVERLLLEPPFTGCASWDTPEEGGELTYHGALYFATLIGLYMGPRREEYCGLSVDDVVDDAPHPYLLFRFNEVRRVKNSQSVRYIVIHPELIRLGFLDYVQKLRELGHKLLFPDLYSPSTKSPLGDRYYDELLPSLRNAGVTPHQFRHFFNNCSSRTKWPRSSAQTCWATPGRVRPTSGTSTRWLSYFSWRR